MEKDYLIRLEKPADYRKTEAMVREAFWNVYRPGCYEHYVLHVLRKSSELVPQLNLVMEKDHQIIGQICFVKAKLIDKNGNEVPVLTFGPLSIAPAYQQKGYGKKLLDYGIAQARKWGASALCIEGNLAFYKHAGFEIATTKGIRYASEPENVELPYFLAKELRKGFFEQVQGALYYTPSAYYVSESDVNKFDQQFPPKEKRVLPGQLA
ncbi:N-acetyltransferase [Pediococcus acidilactici]